MNARSAVALAVLGLLVLPAHVTVAGADANVGVELRHAWHNDGSTGLANDPLVAGFENPVRVILRNPGTTPFTGTVRVHVEPATASAGPVLIENALVSALTTRTFTVHVPIAADAPEHVKVHARVMDASGVERAIDRIGFLVAPPLSVEIVSPRPLGTEPDRLAYWGTGAGGVDDVPDGGTKAAIRASNASTPLVLRVTNRGPALPDAGVLHVRRPDAEEIDERHVVPIGPLDAGASREFTLDPIPPGRNATKLPLAVRHLDTGEDPKYSSRGLAFAFAAPEGLVTAWREASLYVHETDARAVHFLTLPHTLRTGAPVTAVVDVENLGATTLDAEYALVLTPPTCPPASERVVAGVTRVTLAPGASTRFTPTFTLSAAGVWWLSLGSDDPGCSRSDDARVLVEGPARVTVVDPAVRMEFGGGAIPVRVTANEGLQGAVLELRRIPHRDAWGGRGFGTIPLTGVEARSLRIDPSEVRVDLEAGETRVVTFNVTSLSKQVAWFLPTLTLGDRTVTAVHTAPEGKSEPELPLPDTVTLNSDGSAAAAPAWAARVPLAFSLALGAVGIVSHWRARRGG